MLVVEPTKRFTVDQCLEHPWMTAKGPTVNDSTDGLVGGLAGLEVNRRGVVRERTLLSSINSVQVTRVPGTNGTDAVEVQKKNRNTAAMEPRPFDARNPEEFAALGGKGDQVLFGHDGQSHYSRDDIAASTAAGPSDPKNDQDKQPSKKPGSGTKGDQQ